MTQVASSFVDSRQREYLHSYFIALEYGQHIYSQKLLCLSVHSSYQEI